MCADIPYRFQRGDSGGEVLQDPPGPVTAAIVDDDDLVRNALQPQLYVQMFDGRRNAAFLVTRRNDDGKPFEGT